MAEWVRYEDKGTPLNGYFVQAAGRPAAPGVLIFPAWLGISPSIQERAQRLANHGYTAFVADMFATPTNIAAGPRTIVGPFMADRPLMRRRARAALEVLQNRLSIEQSKIAAIGYCFGGCVALELARDGAELAGAASFHGELDTPFPAGPGTIKAKLLVLGGDDDPVVPFASVATFRKEMKAADADYEIVLYSGAKHSFTGEGSLGPERTPEAVLNPKAEARSWRAMLSFFAEVLK